MIQQEFNKHINNKKKLKFLSCFVLKGKKVWSFKSLFFKTRYFVLKNLSKN